MDQNELCIARNPPRKFVRQAKRQSEGQSGDYIRAADPRRKNSRRCAQHVYPGIIARHHSERSLGMEADGLWLETTRGLNARPEKPQDAKFGEGQKFVRVSCKKKSDLAL